MKIFNPFIKLWHWIKETAWIQPLLIVGIVFGIIFSISPIVKACSAMGVEDQLTFYADRKVSLENAFDDDTSKCDAIELVRNIYDADQASASEKDAIISKLPAKKFFLMFYSEECTSCKDNSEAFQYLNENWGKSYFSTEEKFEMVTIDTLQVAKNKDDKDEAAFPELIAEVPEFFETCASEIENTPYFVKGKINESTLENFGEANKDSFPVPTLLLIDFTDTTKSAYSQLMFSIPGKEGQGEGAASKAMTLMDCWNSAEEFSIEN